MIASCDKIEKPILYIPPAADTIVYTASTADLVNPERGFYRYSATHADNYSPLDVNTLKSWRTAVQADGGNYSVMSSLVFRYFVLDGLNDKPLPDELLQKIKADFAAIREAGLKAIPRFTYTTSPKAGDCPEGFICPPYGDASKEVVLQHITQLKPLLQENADVIACLQLGFIGTWGENYYTDHFGDASSNGQSQLFDADWEVRAEILRAVLDALPADRMVQVRYPQLKQRFVYGVNAPVSSAALAETEAFTGTDKARIGMHNDCFLASADDYGTYSDYGNSSSPRAAATSVLKAYAAADNRYVAVGGETCDDAYSPQNDCENAGLAQTEMRTLHYSYLNCAYNNDVNNDWQDGGCMDAIKRNLGYRFVLKKGYFPKDPVKAGTRYSFTLELENEGYASPFNERPLKLILRSQKSGEEFSFDLSGDVRKWYTGPVAVEEAIVTSSGMTAGTYDLFLYLPDKYASIAARPEYAIRLANENTWEETTGYNKLAATLTIQ
ncbi:hypothetical protein FPE01S_01_01440 [Flavihumibacter petaseus NBRC 106054]|uniref:DUF4832 domain-containing protein n=2 Tax=Flavihumibacter TaxID=1004301 RepID=A0A0E9MTN8_9BACT|nr:hypothetical protein FPE01S_01_01440 [Flavihumibacter petaseus NBRC 106054]